MLRAALLACALAVIGVAEGWECRPGCDTENGFCEKPGRCRCKPGWQGENCDRCVAFPGCVHGSCQKAWQCVCERGWVGSLCDQDTRRCSSGPCCSNATCVETGEGGYLCVCPHGYTGDRCHLRRGHCAADRSPCLNGGTCAVVDGSPSFWSCVCPSGFSGDYCEVGVDGCGPAPCQHGGTCTSRGPAFSCRCPPGFTCNDTLGPSPCARLPCANGGTCAGRADGSFRCACPKWFAGPTCSLRHRPRARPAADSRVVSLPAHAFHKLLRAPERDVLRVTLKEVRAQGVLVTHAQLLCFGALALLTCLVILGTTGVVFFGRCETWRANAKYSQLVRRQREHLLKEAGQEAGQEAGHSLHIILPEKIRLSSFGRRYTSI